MRPFYAIEPTGYHGGMGEAAKDGAIDLPGHGSCYICGRENPTGLGVTFRLEAGRVKTEVTLDERQQGPPGHAHGGCLAAVLDEAMGAVCWCAGHPVVAGRLEVDFKRAVPLHGRVSVEAWIGRVSGRKIWAESTLHLPDRTLATRAGGLYVEKRSLFEADYFVPKM